MRESMTVKESDAMWLITHSGTKKNGYLLFDAQNIETPLISSTANYYNMAFKFSRDDSKLIRMMMAAHGFSEVTSSSNKFNLCWGNYLFKDHDYRQLEPWQKLNHFPGSDELTQKDHLYRNVKQMKDNYQNKNFNCMPISFTLPREYKQFCEAHSNNPSTWIVKPIDSSQGRGIYVADQVNQVSPDDIQLVSKYIDSPLLLNGYKFDLRLYVVVTSLDPLVIYLYEDGLVRLAAEKYQEGQELWDPCIHLTNYSVNKFNSNYVKNEEAAKDNHGNKWSLSAFLQHLKTQNVDTVTLMRNVENAVTSTILAASTNMKAASEKLLEHPNTCFELYGFDILIDNNLKPWVLEVNLSPSLNINQPIDLKIKSALIADLFSLIGIKVCDPCSTRKDNAYAKKQYLHYFPTKYSCSPSSCIKECMFEEFRIIHHLSDEYNRRGGWNRIFPEEDTWNIYNGIQEYETPLNLALHKHLYQEAQRSNFRLGCDSSNRPSSAISLGNSAFLQRLACYEQPLSHGLDDRSASMNKGNNIFHETQMKEEELLDNKVKALQDTGDGLLLSKYKARLGFLSYLQGIQRQLMNGIDKEESVEMVSRFLLASGKMLKQRYTIIIPYKGIPTKSRATILSRQLGDFMSSFKKETFIMMEEDLNSKPSQEVTNTMEPTKHLKDCPSKKIATANKSSDTRFSA